MVFSFFKKPEAKMPGRSAARPRPTLPDMKLPAVPTEAHDAALDEPLPALEFTLSDPPSGMAPKAPTRTAMADKLPSRFEIDEADLDPDMAEFDKEFTASSVMAINVEHDLDPLQADVEQVCALYANGQDTAARATLERLVLAYRGTDGFRFWCLLLDLLQLLGDRPAFDRYSLQFAEACETSPPAWRSETERAVGAAAGPAVFSLQGVLTAEDPTPLRELMGLLQQNATLDVDCSKLAGCDDAMAGRLAKLLIQARHVGKVLNLTGHHAFLRRLNERLHVGEATHEPAWRLLLEMLQRHGTQAQFEERAVDFAVSFEVSPPSWESAMPATPARANQPQRRRDDAYYLSGELKQHAFTELAERFKDSDLPVIDFAAVTRMDFASASQLLHHIMPFKIDDKDVIIRSPNHLIAELMAIVGINKHAKIIVPKT